MRFKSSLPSTKLLRWDTEKVLTYRKFALLSRWILTKKRFIKQFVKRKKEKRSRKCAKRLRNCKGNAWRLLNEEVEWVAWDLILHDQWEAVVECTRVYLLILPLNHPNLHSV